MLMSSALSLALCLTAQVLQQAPVDGFKVVFREFDVKNHVVLRGEMLARGGRIYLFRDSDKEILIFDPKSKKIDLIDLERRVQAGITYAQLDSFNAKLKKAIEGSIEKKLAAGGRANEVAAKMTRDLIEPKFAITRDQETKTSKLVNESVQVEARGEADLDSARLSVLAEVLIYSIKLESERNPTRIPPFPRLETIKELTQTRKVRPTEIIDIYRLAGQPLKERRTYELVQSLTDRERAAVLRILDLQGLLKSVRYETYAARE